MKVSVVIATYNHADYIEQALGSVYGQDVPFDFEVIISEDASTDGTREIVQTWRDRYPDSTRLILSEQNVRSNRVIARGFAAARGEYVALLDGDDYWTSPLKLQRQVECLDADPTLSLCFHNAEVVGGGKAPFGNLWTSPTLKPRLTLADLWDGNPFATCGSLFRRSCIPAIPDWYDGFFPVTDWPLYILFAEQGDIAFLPDVMGAYRLHGGGLYSAQPQRAKLAAMDSLYRRLNESLGGRYDAAIHTGHRRHFIDWAKEHLQRGEAGLAKTSLDYARGYNPTQNMTEWLDTAALSARLMFARDKGDAV
jgi:glycosyltransferase involved in cell wall biosynthesis